ncbi:HDOD domain-containing protein [Candidatus Reidiella endopervernicosa]|uniref:HDOD domain-containing protein n=1 Tax=Candidatus Reidiella endopervernicosa TaxID=2738883 RepID=A0A6N0HY38_9GAMM|nr:HDOD domain-containing protein [Candidatus Reidiella endopervernicosa]QKQ27207.1 HDOD domain-containing protein [Candidatus Reidiella endopervernicosa]
MGANMAIELKKVEREILEFPPLPEAVREVTALFGHDHVSFAVLEKKICQDPALTARVLAVANSAFYGFGEDIQPETGVHDFGTPYHAEYCHFAGCDQ